MFEGRPVSIYGAGSPGRDCTYLSDIVRQIRTAMDYPRDALQDHQFGQQPLGAAVGHAPGARRVPGHKPNPRVPSPQTGDVP